MFSILTLLPLNRDHEYSSVLHDVSAVMKSEKSLALLA
jgi:hypothetical protein